jgi:hypothetical protein
LLSFTGRSGEDDPDRDHGERQADATPDLLSREDGDDRGDRATLETTGATMPTLPTRSAEYANRRPATLPQPATASQPTDARSSPSGTPSIPAQGSTIKAPTIITQARTGPGPIIRVERDEQSVAVANTAAAPMPQRIEITGLQSSLGA